MFSRRVACDSERSADDRVPSLAGRNSKSVDGEMCDATFKVIMLGDSGVGKSNVLLRFTKGGFVADSKATVGVEFASKIVQMENNKLVKAQVWDTAGQESYRLIASSYYRNALGVLLTYDVTDRRSFEHVPKWLREVENFAEEDCLVMLVGNKVDLERQGKRAVELVDGREFALRNKIAFIETSALDDIGIDAAFQHLLQAVYNMHENKKHALDEAKEESGVEKSEEGLKAEEATSTRPVENNGKRCCGLC